MTKRIWWIGLVVLAIVCVYKWPVAIDKELEGIKYQLGDKEDKLEQKVTISIEGTYYRNIFKDNRFEGNITIPGERMTQLEKPFLWPLSFSKKLNRDMMSYEEEAQFSHEEWLTYGMITIKGSFDAVAIEVLTPDNEEDWMGGSSWSGTEGIMIAAPATNKKEAHTLATKMCSVLKDGTWN